MVFIAVMVVIATVVTAVVIAVAAVEIVAIAAVAVMVVAVAVVRAVAIAVAGAGAVVIVGAVGFHRHGLGEMSLYRRRCFHSLICRRRKGQLRAGLLTVHRLIILDKGAELKDSSYHITA